MRAMPAKGYSNPKLNATIVPTALDIAWAAGIYEGEGCVHSRLTSPIVSVGQKQRWLCTRLRELFGGAVRKQVVGRNGYTLWFWVVCSSRARKFLASIYPFLSPRRKRRINAYLSHA